MGQLSGRLTNARSSRVSPALGCAGGTRAEDTWLVCRGEALKQGQYGELSVSLPGQVGKGSRTVNLEGRKHYGQGD